MLTQWVGNREMLNGAWGLGAKRVSKKSKNKFKHGDTKNCLLMTYFSVPLCLCI